MRLNTLASSFKQTSECGFLYLLNARVQKPPSRVRLNGESVLYLAESAYLTVSGFSVHPGGAKKFPPVKLSIFCVSRKIQEAEQNNPFPFVTPRGLGKERRERRGSDTTFLHNNCHVIAGTCNEGRGEERGRRHLTDFSHICFWCCGKRREEKTIREITEGGRKRITSCLFIYHTYTVCVQSGGKWWCLEGRVSSCFWPGYWTEEEELEVRKREN